jgi:glycine cleavage system H protein
MEEDSMYPDDLKYHPGDLWARIEGAVATIGVTFYAQSQLGDIVYVGLPEVGDELTQGETLGSIESVKTISDLKSPASGRIIAVNESLEDAPEKINADPYGEGWVAKMEITDPTELSGLLTAGDYQALHI